MAEENKKESKFVGGSDEATAIVEAMKRALKESNEQANPPKIKPSPFRKEEDRG